MKNKERWKLQLQECRELFEVEEAIDALLFEESVDFSLKRFLSERITERPLKRKIVAAFLQEFWRRDDIANSLTEQPFYFSLLLAAEQATDRQIARWFETWEERQILNLLCYLFKHYREGSWRIVKVLEVMRSYDVAIVKAITALKNGFYSPKELSEKSASQLKKRTQRRAALVKRRFDELLETIISAPMTMAKAMDLRDKAHERARTDSVRMRETYRYYYTSNFGVDDWLVLLSFFGYYGHQPSLVTAQAKALKETLLQKIGYMHRIFSNSFELMCRGSEEVRYYLNFVQTISDHLYGLCRDNSAYVAGSEQIVFAVPTKGRKLALLPWLDSVVYGLRSIHDFFAERGTKENIDLSKLPVIVYDQSNKTLFEKNSQYIDKLRKATGIPILHLSLSQCRLLAEKVGVGDLIFTTEQGQMGFGGARNTVFLLSALLSEAIKRGKSSFDEIAAIPSEECKDIFRERTLGISKTSRCASYVIHMGDDDVEVPVSNLLADLYMAEKNRNLYFSNISYYYGRKTHKVAGVVPFQELLHDPNSAFIASRWTSEPFEAGMKALLTSPRLCLNIPLGNEELHFNPKRNMVDPFRRAVVHLAGSRYPLKKLAIHPYIGLYEQVKDDLPYGFGTLLVLNLLDPADKHGRLALPWNSKEGEEEPIRYDNLSDLLKVMSEESIAQTMSALFWKNIEDFVTDRSDKAMSLRKAIDILQKQPLELPNDLPKVVTKEVRKLIKLYKQFKEDALLLDLLATKALQRYKKKKLDVDALEKLRQQLEKRYLSPFAERPLTNALFLILRSVGCGSFSMAVQKATAHLTGWIG